MQTETEEQRQTEWARSVRKEGAAGSLEEHLARYEEFFDHFAENLERWPRKENAGYHPMVASQARFYVPPGARVLDVGCGNGDLLASLRPSYGVGVDISGRMVKLAASLHPELKFLQMPAERLDLGGENFDYILLSDLLGYLYDIRAVFERLRSACHARTRIILHWHSRLWQPVLNLAETMGLKYPLPITNWTTPDDVENLLRLAGYEAVVQQSHILMPKRVPLLTYFANRFLAHLPGLSWFCLTRWVVARPLGIPIAPDAPSVTVVCPCRNEAGNIAEAVRRLPEMGSHTELIFVEGHSKDDTLEACRRAAAENPHRDVKVLVQEGKGKGDAVRMGFAHAKGDILMILDADLSVDPEDLPQFYDALVRRQGEMVNGSRLVYTMHPDAMRFLNLLGNRFFAGLLSWLLGQTVRDTLCGTKVLLKRDYERIAEGRAWFGELDPFGDFDLLYGAAKLGLKIVDVPVRYRSRVYGTTNIHRFSHGWLLLKMSALAALRLFFVA